MSALYLDPVGGVAGDMLLAALIDVGAAEDAIREAIGRLPLSGYRLEVREETRRGFRGRVVRIVVEAEQPHRRLAEVLAVVLGADLPPRVRARARRVFERLAEAEARVHGVDPAEVHFHEVGAVDSIIDIVGTAVALESLGVDDLYAGPIPLGTGTVSGAHGELPLPSPATAELLRGWPVSFTGRAGEHCTPTGAAVISALATSSNPPSPLRLDAVGVGFGARHSAEGPPNMLRAFRLRVEGPAGAVEVLEATVDDMTAEGCGFLMERLFEVGALEAYFQSVQMKKNRPGIKVTALCEVGSAERIARTLFLHSTTLGIRMRRELRRELSRRIETVQTRLGPVRLKIATGPDDRETVAPEYDDCRAIAAARGLPLREVYRIAEEAWFRERGESNG